MSIALFLEEEGENPTEALEKAKHLIMTKGGSEHIFDGNRFILYPIEDTPVCKTLSLMILGETRQGTPLRNRAITLVLAANDDDGRLQRLRVILNQCGVSTAFYELDTKLFPRPTAVQLLMTAEYLEEGFKFQRKRIADFELLPAVAST
jgi:hypothetical protein